eukprot:1336486-Amorphochlora_amoeboformis.AAC.2
MVATAERGAMVFRLPPRAPLIRSVSLRQNSKMKIILLTIFATILIAGMRPRTGALSIGAVRRLATPRQSLFLRGGEDTTGRTSGYGSWEISIGIIRSWASADLGCVIAEVSAYWSFSHITNVNPAKIQPVFGSSPAPAPAPTGDNEKTAKKVQAKKDLEDENWGIEGKHRVQLPSRWPLSSSLPPTVLVHTSNLTVEETKLYVMILSRMTVCDSLQTNPKLIARIHIEHLQAPEIDGVTGEENEEVVWEAQVNVFRMTNGTDWKQRAVGPARMLKHK